MVLFGSLFVLGLIREPLISWTLYFFIFGEGMAGGTEKDDWDGQEVTF